MQVESRLRKAFSKAFGAEPDVLASAPGRVNLIGEHTDYNEGFVFPMAIERRIWVMGRRRDDDVIRLVSLNGMPEIQLDLRGLSKKGDWSDYPVGVANELMKAGHSVSGFEAVFCGDVPVGSGLSSSAALEVSTLHLLMGLYGLEIAPHEGPLVCHRAETQFVGVNCGVMDQFISTLGRAGHALFLDCRNLNYEHVALELKDHVVVIADSKKKRGLVDSEYNRRRAECEAGVRILREHGESQVRALRDVDAGMLEKYRSKFPETVFRRCRHVVRENARVLQSVACLRRGDLQGFGRLLNDSHNSLRDDYEVSCEELDALVETARSVPGVLGSRLTGAGFGGCTVTLVHEEAFAELEEKTQRDYAHCFGYEAKITVTKPSAGAEFRML